MTSAASTKREASPNDVLPFGEFLMALRARGVPVGVKEYEAVERLLRAWRGIDREALRDALGAMLARDQKEVETIHGSFDEWFPAAPREVHRGSRKLIVSITAVVVFMTTALIGEIWYRKVAWPTRAPRLATPAELTAENPLEDFTQQQPSLPSLPALPPPPRADDARIPLLLTAGLALLLAWIAAEIRTRRSRRAWKQDYLEESLESGKGATRYTPVVSNERPLVPDAWVDDVASILGGATDDSPGVHLDVDESLRLTLRQGMLPQLVFEPPPRNAFLLLLEDVHRQMQPWRPKIEALIAGLRRQRVDHERWFFDSHLGYVWREGDNQRITLERLFAMRGAASLLILSAGEGARDLADNAVLQHVLRRWTFRSWLNPIANPAYWNEELSRLPFRMWPFTRSGFRGMAWDLARMPQAANRDISDVARNVTADDLERMKRLIALVPQPTAALADELRRRYTPDVPEEVVLFLIAEGVFRGDRYQLAREEVARLIKTLRADAPLRELRIRRYLLEVLRESEPGPDSLAHLRWQLDMAMQRLHVARLGNTQAAPAVGSLTALATGPLRHEVEAALAVVPLEPGAATALQRQVRRAGMKLPEMIEFSAGRPPRFVLPDIGALVAIAVMTFLAWTQFAYYFGSDRGAEIPHVLDAYGLEVLPPVSVRDAAMLRVTPRAGSPRDFEVWQGDRRVLSSLKNSGAGFQVNVPQTQAGSFFQVRSLLPAGNLALSDAVWVPPASVEQQVIAIIADVLDVNPVTITSEADLRRDFSADDRAINEIATRIEQDFGIAVPLSRQEILSVSEIVRIVRQRQRTVRVTVNVTLNSVPSSEAVIYLVESGGLHSYLLRPPGPITVPPGSYIADIGFPRRSRTRRPVLIPNQNEFVLSLNVTDSDYPIVGFQRNERIGVITAEVFTRSSRSESTLGNLIADAMRVSTGADFAVLNSGALRTDLPRGNLTYGNVVEVLPFNNYPAMVTMTGAQIVELLRATSSRAFGILQVSGLRYAYDASKSGRERLISVERADGSPLDPQKLYKVMMPDFMAAGGDGANVVMDLLPEGSIRVYNANAGEFLRDVIVNQLRQNRKPIIPRLEGRITVLNQEQPLRAIQDSLVSQPPPSGSTAAIVRGSVLDLVLKNGVAGALVSAGGVSTTTDSTGMFQLVLPRGGVYTLRVEHPAYVPRPYQRTVEAPIESVNIALLRQAQ